MSNDSTYTCQFNSEELIDNSVKAIKQFLRMAPMRYTLEELFSFNPERFIRDVINIITAIP